MQIKNLIKKAIINLLIFIKINKNKTIIQRLKIMKIEILNFQNKNKFLKKIISNDDYYYFALFLNIYE